MLIKLVFTYYNHWTTRAGYLILLFLFLETLLMATTSTRVLRPRRSATSTAVDETDHLVKKAQVSKPKFTPKPKLKDKSSPRPVITELDDIDECAASIQKVREAKKKLNLKDIQDLKRKFKQTCDTTKRETQKLEQQHSIKKPAGSTRSGARRGVKQQAVYTDGKWVNKGIDDSQEKFDASEKEYLKNSIAKLKTVNELKYEHLNYLVIDVFLEDLKDIKDGNVDSDFHRRFKDLGGKSKIDLFSEVRTSLFTNEQRDYINGLLQGAFDTTSKDDNGDIKHSDINYVEIVMLAEITIRIVKYVHKFKSNEEAFAFMIKSSREALGLEDDD